MNCKKCKQKLDDVTIYCHACGQPTDSFRKHFSIMSVLQEAKHLTEMQKPSYISIGLFILLAFVITIFNVFDVSAYVLQFVLAICVSGMFMFLFGIPQGNRKKYGLYFEFSLLVVLYFIFLKLICQGDPILNLVRLVLVLWGIAIVFPMPYLIFSKEENVFTLLKKAYIAGKYLRWHQFCLCLYLSFRLFSSFVLLFFFLPSTFVFTANVMKVWYQRQDKYLLYDKRNDY